MALPKGYAGKRVSKGYLVLVVLILILSMSLRPVKAINNGQDAKLGEFPFLVALVSSDDGSQFCGGSILNDEWILTAAHCFFTDDTPPEQDTFAQDVEVKAGIIDLNDTQAQVVGVKEIYHPGYDGETNDIALLHLKKPLKLDNKNVAAIKLNADSKVPAKNVTVMVAGWGALDPNGEKFTDTLKKTSISVVTCDSDTAAEYVCTASKNSKDTCQGDSGGPLVIQQPTDALTNIDSSDPVPGIHALQIGIVSYGGNQCGTGSGYTRVASYIDWINKTIADNSKPAVALNDLSTIDFYTVNH